MTKLVLHVALFVAVIYAVTKTVSGFTACETKIVKKGCYHDPGDKNRRPLNDLLLNHRNLIDWGAGWNNFLHGFTCQCAKMAKEKGYRYIGLQFYGECWSGEHSEDLFKKASDKCWGYKPNYENCDDNAETECIGEAEHNYIYELVYNQESESLNICGQSPCLNNGECVPENDSYVCECIAGYTGQNCEINVNECADNPCLNGECTDGVNSYQCECQIGYEGENCQKDINECAENPCINGECTDGVNSYQCECQIGYEGENCEKDIDDCVKHQCMNGGRCKDEVNSYKCVCTKEYGGKRCETVKMLRIELQSHGCNDKDIVPLGDCSKATASIKVNGIEYAKNERGYNIAVFNSQNGKLVTSRTFDTHHYNSQASVTMTTFLKNLPNGQVVLITTMDEFTSVMTTAAYDMLKRIGARDPLKEYRSSFALIGYTGPGRPSFVKQAQKGKEKGPAKLNGEINIPYIQMTIILRPSSCSNANWWKSFDEIGWSTCANNKIFVTGFYRSDMKSFLSYLRSDEIGKLEEAKCCPAISLYKDQESECKDANWLNSLDNKGTWSTCPSGYFLNGLYRSSGDHLSNIEEGKCCKPVNHPTWYDECYDEDIGSRFDEKGWSECTKIGYFVTGVHRDTGLNNWLHNLGKLKCCKMWTGA